MVNDARFLDGRNLVIQMSIMKESMGKIEINLRLWNVLGGIELENY